MDPKEIEGLKGFKESEVHSALRENKVYRENKGHKDNQDKMLILKRWQLLWEMIQDLQVKSSIN